MDFRCHLRLFGILAAVSTLFLVSCETSPSKLILISMDSLMYEFLEALPARNRTHFDYFIHNGVFAKQILNVFPSSTYPNHYTLLTGLYPESHGLVANKFYDPNLDEFFDFHIGTHNYESKWYDVGAEPIYVTNSKAGGNRKSGTVLFPTGMARVKGIAPDRMVQDDGTYPNVFATYEFPYVNMPYLERVDRLISWFTDKQDPINLGLLYFPEPDEVSHAFGPMSEEVRNEVGGPLNEALGYLIDRLTDHDLLQTTNIILTADHGQTSRQKFAILGDYVDSTSYTTGGSGSISFGLYPKTGKEDEIVKNFTQCPDIEVFKKDTSPELQSMHYTRSDRIAPVVVAAKGGVVMLQTKAEAQNYQTVGLHGYDPVKVPAVRPLFMAVGPGFRKGVESPQFNLVDVYPLMCHLLGITPAPNNGSLDNVRHLLAMEGNGKEGVTYSTYLLIGGAVIFSQILQHVSWDILHVNDKI